MNKIDTKIVDSLLKVGKLKSLKRTGWVRESMPDPESVAEHTFRICFLVLMLENQLDVSTCELLKMALVHDMEEAVTKDPVTERGAKQVGKHDYEIEKKIVKKMVMGFPNPDRLLKLWNSHFPEKGANATKKANLLYQLGKIATAWQALEYELGEENPQKLNEFWENANTHVKEPLLVQLLEKMESKRKSKTAQLK